MKGTLHTTPVGSLKFAAIAKPIRNDRSNKDEYVVRLSFDGTTPEGMTFKKQIHQLNNKKIVTSKLDADGNETVTPGHFLVTFNSTFAPLVVAEDGTELTGREIPFLNFRHDKADGVVTFIIGPKKEGSTNPQYIRLAGVRLCNLQLAPREGSISSLDEIKAKLQQLQK